MLGDDKIIGTPEEIKDSLEGNCFTKEVQTYEQKLNAEELQVEEKDFIQKNIQLAKLKDEFKKVQEEFKNKIKPVEELLGLKLATLRTGSKTKEGTVYLMDDQEKKMMYIYDERGNLLNMRRLLPEERQTHITMAAAVNN